MEESFGFDVPERVGFHYAWEDFLRSLHQAFGPASLLRFETVHIDRQLGSAFDLRKIEKLPALELRAIGKIRVFGERVVLPAAGFLDCLAAPDAGGAIEIEKSAAAGARAVLDDEVAVEEDRFHLGEERVIAVEVGPASLDHSDFGAVGGIDEIRNGAAKKVRSGNEVCVEDGDEFASRGLEAVLEGTSFITFAIGAVEVDDGHTLRGVALDAGAGDLASFVGGIVKDLNVEQFARVVESRDGLDETLDYVALVEDGELDGDAWPVLEFGGRAGDVFRVDIVVVDKPVAVEAISRQDKEDEEVGNHHRKVEGIGVIDAGEGAVRKPVPVMAEGGL